MLAFQLRISCQHQNLAGLAGSPKEKEERKALANLNFKASTVGGGWGQNKTCSSVCSTSSFVARLLDHARHIPNRAEQMVQMHAQNAFFRLSCRKRHTFDSNSCTNTVFSTAKGAPS